MSNLSEITEILKCCVKGTATQLERNIFYEWAEQPENRDQAAKLLEDAFATAESTLDMDAATGEAIFESILSTNKKKDDLLSADRKPVTDIRTPVRRINRLKTAWFRYAALFILIAGAATFLYKVNGPQKEITKQSYDQPTDIQPGGNKAMLTLADGRIIVLDSAANGNLAQQGNTAIIKVDAGALAYNAGQTVANGEVLYNTVRTPKGGQYQVILPDGTKAWLNAASSIRFPTAFGKERIVEITGESYLEVAAKRNSPFFVKTESTTIEVLGTSFNVNAYTDEAAVKVSLIEGTVKIGTAILKPGDAYSKGKIITTNIEQDIAWKNGVFNFNKVSLEQAMSQISKWYNVDVVYEKGIPPITFGGEMGRNLTLTEVLDFLSEMGVHFRLEAGRRVVVVP